MESERIPDTLGCLLCGGLISFKNCDQSKFLSHILNDHDVFLHKELLLAVTFLTEKERNHLISLVKPRFQNGLKSGRDDLKEAMDDIFEDNINNVENKNKQEEANSENLMRGGRDYKDMQNIPRKRNFKHLKHIQDTVSVSTTDCEDLYVMKDTDEELEDDVFTASAEVSVQHKLQEELHSKLQVQHQDQPRDTCYVRCRRCFKVMRRKSYIQHKMTHTGEDRRFGCNFCDTKFRRSDHVKKHTDRFHEHSRASINSSSDPDITLVRCNVCQRQFHSDDILERHMKIHLSARFKQHLPQEKSIARGKENEEFKCDLCGKKFVMEYNLKRHMTSTHRNKDATCIDSDSYMSMK